MNPFLELGIRSEIVDAIADLGFEKPSAIQEQAVPLLLTGQDDFVGLAQTGTGKTAAFGLPLLEQIDFSKKHPQALILCPTRELCLQISKDIQHYAKNMDNVRVVAVYGGASISDQLRQIRRGVQIVVATPGRMLDIIRRNAIDFSEIRYTVLDEADEMLNMGFQEDIDQILEKTPAEKKTWLFSATMPKEVRKIAKKYMDNPKELTVGVQNTGNANIEHQYYIVTRKNKYAALKRLVDFQPNIFGIVFCRTKIEAQEVAENLIRDGYNADSLHGDLSQPQRDKVMKRYRDKSLQILVATDVAARGIDVDNITHVIHYSLPDEAEYYTHRSGRTARAGKKGVSMSLVSGRDMGKIRRLEQIVGKKFEKCEIPEGEEVCERQLYSLFDRMHNVEVNEEQIRPYLPTILENLEDYSKEDIIKRITSLEFNRFFKDYQNAPNLNEAEGRNSDRRDNGKYTRLFLNVGRKDQFSPGDFLAFICDNSKVDGSSIGKIELKDIFSFFEVENEVADTIIETFNGADFEGRELRIEVSSNNSRSRGRGNRRNGRGSGNRRGRSDRNQGFGGKRGKRNSTFKDFSGRSY